MHFTKISGATAALLISMISASPIALTTDSTHPFSGSLVKPTRSLDHYPVRPTDSYHPKEPIPTTICEEEETSKFTIETVGFKTAAHHQSPSGTGYESRRLPKPSVHFSKYKDDHHVEPTGHVSKSHEGHHSKPTGHISKSKEGHHSNPTGQISKTPEIPVPTVAPIDYSYNKRDYETVIVESPSGIKSHKAKPTITGSGKFEPHHPTKTDDRTGELPYETGHAKPSGKGGKEHQSHSIHAHATGTKEQKAHESGYAKHSDQGKEHHSGSIKPTCTGEKHSHISGYEHAKPTGIHEQYIRSDPEDFAALPSEYGHAKPSGKGGKGNGTHTHSGFVEPIGFAKPTGYEHGNGHEYAKPTGVHSHKPVLTGDYSKVFEFKTEILTFGTKTFTITGVLPDLPEKTGGVEYKGDEEEMPEH